MLAPRRVPARWSRLSPKRAAIARTIARDDRGWVAEARVHQPDFGIRPYTAMLGTLRVQADVVVRLRIPAPDRRV